MARVRVTQANVKAKLQDWAASPTNRADELIMFPSNETDFKDLQRDAFFANVKMVIKVQTDLTDPFVKITFVEILS